MLENITCPRCGTDNQFHVVKSGPHLKAICDNCNRYIKFVTQNGEPFLHSDLMPFGKHKGKPIGSLPEDYLIWLYGQPGLMKRIKLYLDKHIDEIRARINNAK